MATALEEFVEKATVARAALQALRSSLSSSPAAEIIRRWLVAAEENLQLAENLARLENQRVLKERH